MLKTAFYRYINNFKGFTREIWILAIITFINRAGTMVLPFLSKYLKENGLDHHSKGKKYEKEECPHCKRMISKSIIKINHLDNKEFLIKYCDLKFF